ncbi:MAG TPA: DUF418 domain-containing protein [Gemmataceae bacterium]|nr:DUF418 domain-containing protein [Gemmataceae bacterium]
MSDPVVVPEGVRTIAPPPSLAPVHANERIASIDVLRGVALLGILIINIWGFALPEIALYNPSAAGGWPGAGEVTWIVCHLLCDQKMMSLFSMLFGAGLIVMVNRADARGTSLTGIYYRRIAWLLLFGLMHAYLLWDGDILVSYALCGFLLYPLRRLRPRMQIFLGLLVFLSSLPLVSGIGLLERHLKEVTGLKNEQGTARQQEMRQALESLMFEDDSTEKKIEEAIENHRAGYAEQFGRRAEANLWMETAGFVTWAGPRAGGLMLVGMGLMQLGVFAALRSYRFYAVWMLIGYGVGFAIVGHGVRDLINHQFDPVHEYIIGGHFNYVGSLFVALGHVGLVMLICKAGLLRRLTVRLAAVGRMALSNYLMQTILCTTLFEGWGFGLFGRLDRLALLGVVGGIWLVQLIASPLWLHSFRFGPLEWLWRSLTYGRRYPFRAVGA